MKLKHDDKYTTISVYVLIVTLVTLVFIIIGVNFDDVLNGGASLINILKPIIYGFIFAFMLLPLVRLCDNVLFKFINRKKAVSRIRRVVSIIASYLVIAVFLALFGFIFFPQVADSYFDLESKISGYVSMAQNFLNNIAAGSEFFADQYTKVAGMLTGLIEDSRRLFDTISPYVVNFISSFLTETKNLTLGIIISVYFLMAKEKLAAYSRRLIRALFSDKLYNYILHVLKLAYVTFSEFLVGETLDAILMGMLLFTFMNLFGMPYAPLVSLIVGVTCFIPSIGAYIGAVPGVFIIFIVQPSKVIWFILLIIGLQQLDCIFIEPKVLSEQNSMSALGVLFAIIIMSGLLGVMGLLIGVPLFMIIRTLTKESLEKRLAGNNMPTSTLAYYNDITEDTHT